MRFVLSLAMLFAVACIPPHARADVPAVGDKVPNFRLLDQRGDSHELYRQADARAVVLFVQGNGCPIVRQSYPALERLRKANKRDVRFFLFNASTVDTREEVDTELRDYDVKTRCLLDPSQTVAQTLGFDRTAEVLIIDTRDWTVAYRGPLDDRFDYGAEKPAATEEYAKQALHQLLEDAPVTVAGGKVKGCAITFAGAGDEVSYARDVAPILLNKCVPCHNANGTGPFAFSSHRKAAGWANMTREVLLTDRMPPWTADPAHGDFVNDSGLTPAEKRTLVAWIDAGAPADEGDDPLAAYEPPPATKWKLGAPDKVLILPEPFTVPAEGTVEYQLIEVPTGLTEDRWIRGIEVRPGNPKVVHHCLVFIQYPEDRKHQEPRVSAGANGFFAGFVPGAEPAFYPEGTGKFMPAGATLLFQMHYVTTGREEVDQTEMGLYFHDAPPKNRLLTQAAYKADFEIPPGDPDYTVFADEYIGENATLYALSPHMHYRGSRMKYTAVYPDKRREILLSVPNYNFDWQHTYRLAEPRKLPRGTRIVVTGAFDNSPLNPYNPDPNAEVHFGDQTWEEMFIGYYWCAVPQKAYQARLERRKRHLEEARARFREEHPEAFEGPPLTEESILNTLWREDEWKFRFKPEGVLLVNDLIKGVWKMENQKVIIDVVGSHFELDVIGNGLYFNGSYPITRLE